MHDISSCGSRAFLHLARMAPSGHLAPGHCGPTIHLPLALLSVHVPDSSDSGFGRVLYLLTSCWTPISAAAMVSVSSKSSTVSSLTWVSCSCTHSLCNSPSSHHQCMSCRVESLGIFYQVVLSAEKFWVALSSCLGDKFVSWCGYFCLVFIYFIALLFLLIALLSQRLLLSLLSRWLKGRNSCRCCLSLLSAFPIPSFSLMGLSPF